MKMLSRHRPYPSSEIWELINFSLPVQATDGHWLRWSVFMILGGPKFWIASFYTSTQKSASSVLEMRQANTL